VKRPVLRLPEIPPALRKELLITGGFAGGLLLCAAAIALVYFPAGLFVLGAELCSCSFWAARRLG
jgi:hypothetical protein